MFQVSLKHVGDLGVIFNSHLGPILHLVRHMGFPCNLFLFFFNVVIDSCRAAVLSTPPDSPLTFISTNHDL